MKVPKLFLYICAKLEENLTNMDINLKKNLKNIFERYFGG